MAPTEKRQRSLEVMSSVYGWEFTDVDGDFFAHTADHLFGEVWTREGLTNRDRRLLLLGLLAGQGIIDICEIQVGAALTNEELTPEQLEEIGLFLCYYAGWPLGSKFNMMTGKQIHKYRKAQKAKEDAPTKT